MYPQRRRKTSDISLQSRARTETVLDPKLIYKGEFPPRTLILASKVSVSGVYYAEPFRGDHERSMNVQAIWDTGATHTVINKTMVKRLGLIPVRETDVETANGTRKFWTYYINIALTNHIKFLGIEAFVGNMGNVEMLLGMDVITQGEFSIDSTSERIALNFARKIP